MFVTCMLDSKLAMVSTEMLQIFLRLGGLNTASECRTRQRRVKSIAPRIHQPRTRASKLFYNRP
jgi:hypothetical protein